MVFDWLRDLRQYLHQQLLPFYSGRSRLSVRRRSTVRRKARRSIGSVESLESRVLLSAAVVEALPSVIVTSPSDGDTISGSGLVSADDTDTGSYTLVKGDVNNDGVFGQMDVDYQSSWVAGLQTQVVEASADPYFALKADVNGDGQTNGADVVYMASSVAGLSGYVISGNITPPANDLDFGGNVLWSDTIIGTSNGSVHTFTVDGSPDSGAEKPVELPVSQADTAPVAASDSGWMSFVDEDRTAAEQDTEVSSSPAPTSPVTTPDAAWISFVDDGSSDEEDEEDRPRPIAIGVAVNEPVESHQSSRINPDEPFEHLVD